MQSFDVCLPMKLFLKLKLLFGMRLESKKMEKIFSANSLISSSSRFSMMAKATILSWSSEAVEGSISMNSDMV